MTEGQYLQVLTVAIGIITAGAGIISGMLAWYLKSLHSKIAVIEKIQADIGQQHIHITTNYLTRFTNLEQKMVDLFEELRGVLKDHFTHRHAEVVQEIALIQNQLTENVRRSNDAATDFYKKYAGTLEWAKQQSEKRRKDVQ